MFSRGFGELVDTTSDQPEAWPALAVGVAVVVVITAGLFWMLGTTPNFGGPYSDIGAIVKFGVAALLACMLITAAVWTAIWFGYVKRTGREVADKYFAILLAAALASVGSVTAAKVAMTAGPREVASMERAWRETLLADNRDFVAKMNALRIERALDAEALAKDSDLSEAKDRLRRAHELVARSREIEAGRERAARIKLAAIRLPAEERARVLAAFDAERRRTAGDLQEYWDTHEDILIEADTMVAFLQRRKGAWTVEGDMVLFRSQPDLAAFRRHMKSFRDRFSRLQVLRGYLGAPTLLRHEGEANPAR